MVIFGLESVSCKPILLMLSYVRSRLEIINRGIITTNVNPPIFIQPIFNRKTNTMYSNVQKITIFGNVGTFNRQFRCRIMNVKCLYFMGFSILNHNHHHIMFASQTYDLNC